MRRLLLAGTAVVALTMIRPPPAHALFGAGDVIVCANCSDLINQAQEKLQQISDYELALQERITHLQSYYTQLQNAIALPQQIYSQVTGDIMMVRSLANSASLLTGNSGNILTRLQMAGAYVNQAALTPSMIGSQLTMWRQTISQANNSMARTLGVQQGQEQNYAALQTAIQRHSQTAAGQMQAIQAGNEMAALTNTQLQQLQTTLVAVATAKQTTDIVAADRDAAMDQALQNMMVQTPIPLTGYRSW